MLLHHLCFFGSNASAMSKRSLTKPSVIKTASFVCNGFELFITTWTLLEVLTVAAGVQAIAWYTTALSEGWAASTNLAAKAISSAMIVRAAGQAPRQLAALATACTPETSETDWGRSLVCPLAKMFLEVVGNTLRKSFESNRPGDPAHHSVPL